MNKIFKVLFISFIGDVKDVSKGYVKKDIEKVDALNRVDGITCLGVSFSDEIESDYNFKPNYLMKKLPKKKIYKFFSSWFQNIVEFKNLSDFLDINTFDVALFRYTIASRSLYKLIKKHRNKIIFEHNCFEYDEELLGIKNRRKELKFSLKPGYFLYYLEGKFWPLFCEKYYGPKIRSLAKAGFSVTKEIAIHEQSLSENYKNIVVTNGIKYNSNLLQNPPLYSGRELNLFMLLGTGAPWHGVDRLLTGLANYKGKLKINIDIIGYYNESDLIATKKLGLENQVLFIDPMIGDALTEKINKYHISIGTLGLHRKNLKEATPLKVRESLMRGIPNIIAYDDTDFMEPSLINDFILKLPADDSPIDFNEIEKFADKILVRDNYTELISNLAKPIIDFDIKALQMVEFIKQGFNE